MDAEVIRDKDQMRAWSRRRRFTDGKTVALVPTMGYLHDGHISLVNEARAHADALVVSIYLNPAQFAPTEDLSTYPSDFAGDLQKLADAGGVDAVFCPTNLYHSTAPAAAPTQNTDGGKVVSCIETGEDDGSGHQTWIRVEGLEKGLCGESRPVFFRGVATVVAKLFNIVEPDVAIFGKKDYQQWCIICRMVLAAIDIFSSSYILSANCLSIRLYTSDRVHTFV